MEVVYPSTKLRLRYTGRGGYFPPLPQIDVLVARLILTTGTILSGAMESCVLLVTTK